MDEPRRSESALPISLMLALAAALAGGILLKEPLKSSRPAITEEQLGAPEKVKARLWQDPFRAVAAHRKKEKGAPPTQHHPSLDRLGTIFGGMGGRSLAALGVMLDGTPYAEGSESRLRSRYAVVSALDRAGYVALDGDHLQFFTWHPAPEDRCMSPAGGEVTVPFELYERNRLLPDDAAGPLVLVLWLNDDEFGAAPLCLVAALRGRFEDMVGRYIGLEFGFIGPRSSNSLLAMLKDATGLVAAHRRLSPTPGGGSVPIYSPWATAWYPILARELGLSGGEDGVAWIRRLFGRVGVDFVPAIQTDFTLAKELVGELKRRQVKPGKDAIALIYELDTFYGRALPLTLATVVKGPSKRATAEEAEDDAEETADGQYPLTEEILDRDGWDEKLNLRSYVYLRGLDGELPRPSDAGKESDAPTTSAGTTPQASATTMGVEVLERPLGPSQLDYVRRLAQQMVRDRPPGGFRAIGVVGSDVYDKLLILQAVRPYFPGAAYFTTDLDARLLHRGELPWTRNLIVASGFGLALDRDDQGNIPPFRDVYQTSVFYACLRALEDLAPLRGGKALGHPGAHARLYEIGLTGAVDLSVDAVAPSPLSIHPARADLLPSWPVRVGAALGIVLAVGLVIPFIGLQAWAWLSGAALLIAATVMVLVDAGGAEGKPFAWLAGVSIWPAVVLRIVAGVLSAWFIVLSCRQLRDNFHQLSERFRLRDPAPASEAEPAGSGGVVSMARLWQRYGEEGAWRKRVVRAGLFVVIVMAFAATVMQMLDPPANPVRGTISLWSNRLSLVPSVLLMLFLFGMVLDATVLCKTRLIEPLIGKRPGWSRDLVEGDLHLSQTDIPFWEQWLAFSLIGEHTEVVRRLIYFPFIALSIMILSRNRLFDNFDFPPALLTIWVVISLLAITSVWTLRSRAEALRKSVVNRLSDEQVRASAFQQTGGEQLKLRIERLKHFGLGVFASPLNQPVVSAVLLGALSVLQFFLVQD